MTLTGCSSRPIDRRSWTIRKAMANQPSIDWLLKNQ